MSPSYSVICPCRWESRQWCSKVFVALECWWHAFRSPACRSPFATYMLSGPGLLSLACLVVMLFSSITSLALLLWLKAHASQ